MIFRKGKRDSILVSYALLKGFLVVLLLFNPQIFLQCWYGGTHHDSLLAPDVFKCKREKKAEIRIINHNSEKRDKKWCSKLLDFHFLTTLTSTRKSLLCKSWFTACLSLILNQCDQKSLALRILLTQCYIFISTNILNHDWEFLQGVKAESMRYVLLHPDILFIPPNFTPKNCAKKKSGQNNVVGLFLRTLHFIINYAWLQIRNHIKRLFLK